MKIGYKRPDGEGLINDWQAHPEGNPWERVRDMAIKPDVPDESTYITSDSPSAESWFTLDNIEKVKEVKNVKVHAYIQCAQSEEETLGIDLYFDGKTYGVLEVKAGTSASWQTVDFGDAITTKEQLDECQIVIDHRGEITGVLGVFAIYMEVEYEEDIPEPDKYPALPKIKKALSGYNYFIKKYIEHRNKGIAPYKLPDGTKYEG